MESFQDSWRLPPLQTSLLDKCSLRSFAAPDKVGIAFWHFVLSPVLQDRLNYSVLPSAVIQPTAQISAKARGTQTMERWMSLLSALLRRPYFFFAGPGPVSVSH